MQRRKIGMLNFSINFPAKIMCNAQNTEHSITKLSPIKISEFEKSLKKYTPITQSIIDGQILQWTFIL